MNLYRILFAILLMPLLGESRAFAGGSSLTGLTRALGQNLVNQCLTQEEGCRNLPFDALIHAAAPSPTPAACTASLAGPTPSSNPGKEEEEQTTILLIAEKNTRNPNGPVRSPDYNRVRNLQGSLAYPTPSHGGTNEWPTQSLVNFAKANSGENEIRAQTLFINGLARLTQESPGLSENEIATRIAGAMQAYSPDKEIRLQLLTNLSELLYDNYNDERNPLQHTGKDPIATQNLSLSHMINAAVAGNEKQGGVCNDINQALAQVAAKLFPKEDVFTINSGSHYALLMSDEGKVRTIINQDERTTGKGDITIDPEMPTTNTRIAKVDQGVMREVTVAETELGQVFRMAAGEGTRIIQTGYRPSLLLAEFEKGRNALGAGVAQTSNSEVLVLVAKHRGKLLGFESFTQVGGGVQRLHQSESPVNVVFAVQQNLSRQVFQYVGPGVTIRGTTGVQLDATYGRNLDSDAVGSWIPSFSGNFQTQNAIDFRTTPRNPKAPVFTGRAEVDHFFGFTNVGAHHGAMSAPGWNGIKRTFDHSGLILNQVNAQGAMHVPIQAGMSSITKVDYQGTAIGQVAGITTGLSVQAPLGVRVYAFVGYQNGNWGGYRSQNNLLNAPTGAQGGLRLQTEGGTNISGFIQGVGGNQGVQGNVKIGIPIKRPASSRPDSRRRPSSTPRY